MSDNEIGSMASTVTSSTDDLPKVVTGASEAAGVGEAVVEIEKFKVHKDNPTQIPIK